MAQGLSLDSIDFGKEIGLIDAHQDARMAIDLRTQTLKARCAHVASR